MTEIAPVAVVTLDLKPVTPASPQALSGPSAPFPKLVADGIGMVSNKVDHANKMVQHFTLDDSVPIHQVTIALEEARIAVELAMQIRSHFLEGYREIMNMQL